MSDSSVSPRTVARQAPLSMEILQARILEWVAIFFSKESSRTKDQTHVSCTVGGFFTTEPPEMPLLRYGRGIMIPNTIYRTLFQVLHWY